MLAYDYPLLGLFWTMSIFFLWAAWLFAAIWSFIDNFRRDDHGGFAKAAWAIFIVLIPLLGVFVYIVARPASLRDRRCTSATATSEPPDRARSTVPAAGTSAAPRGVAERARRGQAARAASPPLRHGAWEPPARTAVGAGAILEEQGRNRVAELLPIRYGRMVATPFVVLPGAAAIMAADLADTPRTGLARAAVR